MADIEFALLENSLDFIESGLRHISRAQNKRDLKYATLHLASGIELVLKARLEREDWRLLFIEPEEADERRYTTGDFKSIGMDTCIDRFVDECGIEIRPEDRATLTSFRRKRNRFEHFAIIDTKEAVEASAVSVLSIVLDFVNREFEHDELSEEESRLLEAIRTSIAEFRRFTEERLQIISPRIKEARGEYGAIVQCPLCLQKSLSADVNVECLFCGYKAEAEDAAEMFIANVLQESRYRAFKEGYDYPLYLCPNCDNQALVDKGISGGMAPQVQFVCFACGFEWLEGDLRVCELCGNPKDPEDFFAGQCSDCFRAYTDRDNT